MLKTVPPACDLAYAQRLNVPKRTPRSPRSLRAYAERPVTEAHLAGIRLPLFHVY